MFRSILHLSLSCAFIALSAGTVSAQQLPLQRHEHHQEIDVKAHLDHDHALASGMFTVVGHETTVSEQGTPRTCTTLSAPNTSLIGDSSKFQSKGAQTTLKCCRLGGIWVDENGRERGFHVTHVPELEKKLNPGDQIFMTLNRKNNPFMCNLGGQNGVALVKEGKMYNYHDEPVVLTKHGKLKVSDKAMSASSFQSSFKSVAAKTRVYQRMMEQQQAEELSQPAAKTPIVSKSLSLGKVQSFR